MNTKQNLCQNSGKYALGMFLVLFVAVGLIPGPAAHAASIIISDNFNRPGAGTANLDTSTPGTDTTAEAHTWSVYGPTGGSIITDGSVAQLTASPPDGGGYSIAYGLLPFQLTDAPAHALITLSGDVAVNSDLAHSGYLIALGFSEGSTGSEQGALYDGGPFLWLGTNGTLLGWPGPGVVGSDLGGAPSVNLGTVPNTGTSALGNLKITYDTDSKVASFYFNNTLEGSYTYGSAPTINDVIIETYGESITGTVDNLLLTAEVPEPASLSLLALGGALLLRRRV